ncbi:protein kinase [uncultured Legionella sp.]|uniref:protein kinase domain-containing protein n=1 Tax=uncultured Legionella sp. TaxID=210934 RepID=UPI00261AAB9B|nr:protein kinase [uncultured Legionella sp.]
MQNKSDEKQLIQNKEGKKDTTKEILLTEWRNNIRTNTLLSPELKTTMLIEIDKLELLEYLKEKDDLENNSKFLTDAQSSEGSSLPEVKTTYNAALSTDNQKNQPNKRSQNRNRTLSLALEGTKEKRRLSLNSPPRNNSPKSGSPRDEGSPRTPVAAQKKPSPRRFFTDSDSGSPRLVQALWGSSSNLKKEPPEETLFYNSLPIDRKTMAEYISRLKPQLNDAEIHMSTDPDKPHLQLLVIPQRDMKNNKELKAKTIILLDRSHIEGKGAYNTVVKGYDLINKNYLAIKIFASLTTKASRDIEIENLQKRGWFYGCYELREKEYALLMKYFPGETLLKTLYETDESVSTDSVLSNYCTKRKPLNFNLKCDIIYKLMEQLVTLHTQYKLLHRDLKPANIQIYFENEETKVRIIDLGDALPIDSKKKGLCGTDGYTDPDIWDLDEPKPYEIYADIFSLAVIIAEILSEKTKNYQQALREQLYKNKKDSPFLSPWISPKQIQEMMDDVFDFKTTPDKFSNFTDHEENMHQFILLELKKLAKNMLLSRLRNSSLSDELTRIKELVNNCAELAPSMEKFISGKQEVEKALTSIYENYCCFYQPQKKVSVDSLSIQDATEKFKSMHTTLSEDYQLFI